MRLLYSHSTVKLRIKVQDRATTRIKVFSLSISQTEGNAVAVFS